MYQGRNLQYIARRTSRVSHVLLPFASLDFQHKLVSKQGVCSSEDKDQVTQMHCKVGICASLGYKRAVGPANLCAEGSLLAAVQQAGGLKELPETQQVAQGPSPAALFYVRLESTVLSERGDTRLPRAPRQSKQAQLQGSMVARQPHQQMIAHQRLSV